MPEAMDEPTIVGRRFLMTLVRLARIYWSSPDAKRGVLLLALTVLLELATVYGNFQLADAERRVLDALEQRQAGTFFAATGLFLAVMLGFVLVSTYRIYARQALEIRWRRGLTGDYLERWIAAQAYSQMRLHPGEVDDPDQRIAEDVREFVASALGLSLSLLSALVTLLCSAACSGRCRGTSSSSSEAPIFACPGSCSGSPWRTPRSRPGSRTSWAGASRRSTSTGSLRGRVPLRARALPRQRRVGVGGALARRGIGTPRLAAALPQRGPELVAADSRAAEPDPPHDGHRTDQRPGAAVGRSARLYRRSPDARQRRPDPLRVRSSLGCAHLVRECVPGDRPLAGEYRAPREPLRRDRRDRRDLQRAGVRVVPGEAASLRLGRPARARRSCSARLPASGPSVTAGSKYPRERACSSSPKDPISRSDRYAPSRRTPRPKASSPMARSARRCDCLGLDHLETRLDDLGPWDPQLSGSEQQRLALVRVLLNRPDWIFLDKATSELDE